MTELPFYAVLYKPGSRWNDQLPFHEQVGVGDHRDFLTKQYEAQTLAFGGPFLDNSGGLSVFQAASLEQLEDILRTDQSVTTGLLEFEIRPYHLGFKPRLIG
ncbi:MAG: hypothetical protein JOZ77_04140 [Candidatus Eremiobacteraeota bacterium]|nr:hypothetical protein [Candidatus Eremiobacteraeota bacterium]